MSKSRQVVTKSKKESRARGAVSNRANTLDAPNDAATRFAAQTSSDWREQLDAPEISARTWQIASLSIIAMAAFLRLYDIGLKPLHHDEGVNGFFLARLFREGIYQYDPANYHGPTLYYFAFLSSLFFGLSTFAIRFVPALFGIATVWLILLLRRYIGSMGALTAALLVAVSPGAVYMSRYFIHESLFVFFTLGTICAILYYYEEAQPIYLMLAAISAALLFATKETAMISAGVIAIATVAAPIYLRLRNNLSGENGDEEAAPVRGEAASDDARSSSLARFGGATRLVLMLHAACYVFLFVYILFYSSFFTYSKGLTDSLKTFQIWSNTGKTQHVHEWYSYLKWMWQEEAPLLTLGAAGILLALWRARRRFPVFAALWTLGIIAAYSLIKYKTPWLVLNFIIPLGIMSGYALDTIYRADFFRGERPKLFWPALVLAGIASAICLYQTIALNFYHYDDEAYPYVYAHTRREFLPLVDAINRFAKRAGTNEQTGVAIMAPEYWPLPWYLRDYKHVGFHGRIVETNDPLVIISEPQEAEFLSLLGTRYARVDFYPMRPGVTLILYVRRDLAGP